MSLNVKPDDNRLPVTTDAAATTSQPTKDSANINPVVALLKAFVDNCTAQDVLAQDQTKEVKEAELKKIMEFMVRCTMELQEHLGELNKLKDGFLSEQSKQQIDIAIAAGEKAKREYQEYLAKKKEAEEAQKTASIFGWLVAALSIVVAALTGGACAMLVAVAITVLTQTGVMDQFKDELKKAGLPDWAADLVICAVVITASMGANLGSVAGQAARTAVAEQTGSVLSKASQMIKEICKQLGKSDNLKAAVTRNLTMNVAEGVTTSGFLGDVVNLVIDAAAQLDPDKDDPKHKDARKYAAMAITAVLSIVISFAGMRAANLAGNGTSMVSDLFANIPKVFGKEALSSKAMTSLWQGLKLLEALSGVGQGSAKVAEGALTLEAAPTLEESGHALREQMYYMSLTDQYQSMMETSHEDFLTNMSGLDGLIKKIFKGFGIPESEAKALS